jgi:hypothetical protein
MAACERYAYATSKCAEIFAQLITEQAWLTMLADPRLTLAVAAAHATHLEALRLLHPTQSNITLGQLLSLGEVDIEDAIPSVMPPTPHGPPTEAPLDPCTAQLVELLAARRGDAEAEAEESGVDSGECEEAAPPLILPV